MAPLAAVSLASRPHAVWAVAAPWAWRSEQWPAHVERDAHTLRVSQRVIPCMSTRVGSAQIYWVGIGMGSNFKDCCSLSVLYSLSHSQLTRHRNRKNLSNRVSSQSIRNVMVFITHGSWGVLSPDCP